MGCGGFIRFMLQPPAFGQDWGDWDTLGGHLGLSQTPRAGVLLVWEPGKYPWVGARAESPHRAHCSVL